MREACANPEAALDALVPFILGGAVRRAKESLAPKLEETGVSWEDVKPELEMLGAPELQATLTLILTRI